jgi:hypothetical protein
MVHEDAIITCNGDVNWLSGSMANFTENGVFRVSGDWDFRTGSNANLADGFVNFVGTGISWIRSYSPNSRFNDVSIYKSGVNNIIRFSNLSTSDLLVNRLYVEGNANFESWSDFDIIIGDVFSSYGNYDLTKGSNTGSLRFNGQTTLIYHDAGSVGLMNNVVFDSSNGATLWGDLGIVVKGNLMIESGTFDSNGLPVELHSDWINNGGTYEANNSVVIFNGDGAGVAQDISGINVFYDVVKTNSDTYLRFSDPNTISNNLELHNLCRVFENLDIGGTLNLDDPLSQLSVYSSSNVTVSTFDQGGNVFVTQNSVLTINDIVEQEIIGTYELFSGEINLTQDLNDLVDMNADITIEDGQFIVNGGVGMSWWAFNKDASLTMTGGVLDFNNAGCDIYDSPNTLTLNLSGGTIRTSGNLIIDNPLFTPSFGTIELYSSSDVDISTTNGSNVNDLTIAKNAKSAVSLKLSERDIASGIKPKGKAPMANTVNLFSDYYINGDFVINNGVFNTDVYDMFVVGEWTNNVGDVGFLANSNTVTFNGDGVNQNNVNGTSTFYDIVQLNTGTLLKFFDPNTISNNLELHHFCFAYDILSINGILDIDDNTSKFYTYSGANVTVAQLDQGGEIVVLYETSSLTINDLVEPEITGTYSLLSGEINLTQDPGSFVDMNAYLTIEDGQFIVNGGNGLSFWAYNKNASLNMSGGILDFNNAGCNIYDSPNVLNMNISGGIIRTAGNFVVDNPAFTPTAGTLELYSSNDADISTANGSNVFNLEINKNAKFSVSFSLSERDIALGIKPKGKAPMANTVTLFSGLNINGNLNIYDGILNSDNYNIYIAGDWYNEAGSTGFVANSNTVTFDGNAPADILSDEVFYNLSLEKTHNGYNGLELDAGHIVNVLNNLHIIDGGMEINENAVLDLENNIDIDVDAGLNINDVGAQLYIGGNWTNDNTLWNISGTGFAPGSSVTTFDGTTDQTITTNADREDFGKLVIDKTGGEFKPNDSINVMDDFTLTQGLWHDNTIGLTHYFQGDFFVADGNIAGWNSLTGNTVVFKGTAFQNIYNQFGFHYFYKMIVDKTDFAVKKGQNGGEVSKAVKEQLTEGGNKGEKGSTVTLISSIDIEHSLDNGLTIEEGTLDLNGNTLYTMGDININDGGKIIINDNARLIVDENDSLNVNSGGMLEAIGSAGANAGISNRNNGYYDFTVKTGGTISAVEATFEDMSMNGVFVMEGATIDPANAFTNCTFKNGTPGFAGLLGLNSDQTLTLMGLNFPLNTNGTEYNIFKTSNVGEFTIKAAFGPFMGPEYELDNFNRVNWGDINIELDLRAFLEGPFNGVDMNTDLRDKGVLPLSQPFNEYPYWYEGTESVGSIPVNVVDWVLVELRDAYAPANADNASVFEERAAFLLNDGSIVDIDGSSPLTFNTTYEKRIYPVIIQLNHLAIVSDIFLQRDINGIYAHDFTNGSAFGGAAGQKEVTPGVWAMFGGDSSGEGSVDNNDITGWRFDAGRRGYLFGDYNLDAEVDNKDKNDICIPNLGKSSQVIQPMKSTSGNNERFTKE